MVALPASAHTADHEPIRGEAALSTSVPGWAAAGLYVPSYECAHAGHEFTQKIRRSKASREHDPEFARLLAATAARHFPGFNPDVVVSIPPKPGQEDRFHNIRDEVARRMRAADAGPCSARPE